MEQGKFRRLVSPSSIWTCATGQAHKAQGIQNRRESTPGGEHQPLDRYRRKLYREGLESPTTPKTLRNPDHKPTPDHHYPQQELAESNPKLTTETTPDDEANTQNKGRNYVGVERDHMHS